MSRELDKERGAVRVREMKQLTHEREIKRPLYQYLSK